MFVTTGRGAAVSREPGGAGVELVGRGDGVDVEAGTAPLTVKKGRPRGGGAACALRRIIPMERPAAAGDRRGRAGGLWGAASRRPGHAGRCVAPRPRRGGHDRYAHDHARRPQAALLRADRRHRRRVRRPGRCRSPGQPRNACPCIVDAVGEASPKAVAPRRAATRCGRRGGGMRLGPGRRTGPQPQRNRRRSGLRRGPADARPRRRGLRWRACRSPTGWCCPRPLCREGRRWLGQCRNRLRRHPAPCAHDLPHQRQDRSQSFPLQAASIAMGGETCLRTDPHRARRPRGRYLTWMHACRSATMARAARRNGERRCLAWRKGGPRAGAGPHRRDRGDFVIGSCGDVFPTPSDPILPSNT